MQNLNYTIQDQIRDYVVNTQYDDLEETVLHINKKIKTRITVITLDGKVLADTDEDPAVMENHAGRPEIVTARSGKRGSSVRFSHTVKKNMLYVALPLYYNGSMIAVTRVSLYINYVEELYDVLRNKILIITFISILISILIIYLFSKNITGSIKELANASAKSITC